MKKSGAHRKSRIWASLEKSDGANIPTWQQMVRAEERLSISNVDTCARSLSSLPFPTLPSPASFMLIVCLGL